MPLNSEKTLLSSFEILTHKINGLPLWVKQVIYAELKIDLETLLSKTTLEKFTPEHTLQSWTPELTRSGLKEIEQPSGTHPSALTKLLKLTQHQKNILTITLTNNWTLEQTSKVLSHAIHHEMIAPPKSMVITGTIDYLSGSTRLGEYLVQINRLNPEQLNQALQTQKTIEEAMGERTGIAEILINLGYIKKEDSEGILFLKQESKKLFSWE
ncbi:MAG: hypothetical protein AAGI66_03080 [Cyanobacteria bacterium P01_H01_bin.74]